MSHNIKADSIFDIEQVPLISAPAVLISARPTIPPSESAVISPGDAAYLKVKDATEKIVKHLRSYSKGRIMHPYQIVEFIKLNNVGSPVNFEYVPGQNLIRGTQGNTIFELEI